MLENFLSKNNYRDKIKELMINPKSGITKRYLHKLAQEGVISYFYGTYPELVKEINQLKDQNRIILLSEKRFIVRKKESAQGLKSLADLVKIDGQLILKTLSAGESYPERLTQSFLEEHKILPQDLISTAFNLSSKNTQPRGFYWVDFNNTVNVVTWLNAFEGLKMKLLHDKAKFEIKIIDKKLYGNNIRIRVGSRTSEGQVYEFALNRLPIYKKGDIAKFSGWVNMKNTSNDLDAVYRGLEHNQRKNPLNYWSATAIAGFYEAMSFINRTNSEKKVRTNPFPIPADRSIVDYIQNVESKILVAYKGESGDIRIRRLNKGEVEKLVGAKTEVEGYNFCWNHTKKVKTDELFGE